MLLLRSIKNSGNYLWILVVPGEEGFGSNISDADNFMHSRQNISFHNYEKLLYLCGNEEQENRQRSDGRYSSWQFAQRKKTKIPVGSTTLTSEVYSFFATVVRKSLRLSSEKIGKKLSWWGGIMIWKNSRTFTRVN